MYPFHITEHKHTASLLPGSTLPSAHLCGTENGRVNILSPLFESSPPLPGKQRRGKQAYLYTHASPQCPSAIVLTVAPRSRLQGKQVLRLCRCVFLAPSALYTIRGDPSSFQTQKRGAFPRPACCQNPSRERERAEALSHFHRNRRRVHRVRGGFCAVESHFPEQKLFPCNFRLYHATA